MDGLYWNIPLKRMIEGNPLFMETSIYKDHGKWIVDD